MNPTISRPIAAQIGRILSQTFKPLPDLKKEYPGGTESLKLYFNISNQSHHRGIGHSIDGQEQQLDQIIRTRPRTACLWIDVDLFEQNDQGEILRRFAPELDRIGIISIQRSKEVVLKISEEVKMMMRSVPKRRKVMVIEVQIKSEVIHRVLINSDLDRAMRESGIEYENRNYGMVAADLEAAKRMMNLVIIGDEDECRICLEEIKETGMRMPCEHLFHENCIFQWLQISHCCPLCRFLVPASVPVH